MLESVAQPLDAAALFGHAAPLEVEVGSGKGLFLSAAAAGDPAANFLGIELLAKYARFTAARLAKRDLSNARVIQGDASICSARGCPTHRSGPCTSTFPIPGGRPGTRSGG